jgi:hypothetical protein
LHIPEAFGARGARSLRIQRGIHTLHQIDNTEKSLERLEVHRVAAQVATRLRNAPVSLVWHCRRLARTSGVRSARAASNVTLRAIDSILQTRQIERRAYQQGRALIERTGQHSPYVKRRLVVHHRELDLRREAQERPQRARHKESPLLQRPQEAIRRLGSRTARVRACSSRPYYDLLPSNYKILLYLYDAKSSVR